MAEYSLRRLRIDIADARVINNASIGIEVFEPKLYGHNITIIFNNTEMMCCSGIYAKNIAGDITNLFSAIVRISIGIFYRTNHK